MTGMDQLVHFLRNEQGQDLIEYSLLMTFIAIACLAYFGLGHNATAGITSTANSQLVAANTIAGGS
jgi:Flp pilus assembly pilin Flp